MSEETAAQPNVNMSNETGNAAFNVAQTVADAPAERTLPQLADIIPDGYRDKPWLQKYTNVDDFFKGMDGMQELLGKRPAGIPHETAGQEEWDEFYTQLGRPKTAEEYKIEYADDLPDGLKINDEQKQEFSKIAHELGLTQKQVERLAQYDLETKKALLESSQPDMQKLNDEFDQFAKQTFGDRQNEAIDNATKLIAKHAPKEMHEHIKSLDNKALIALTSVLDEVTKSYIKEGRTFNDGDTPAPMDKNKMMKEKNDLMRSDAYKNEFHIDHGMTRERVNELAQALYG